MPIGIKDALNERNLLGGYEDGSTNLYDDFDYENGNGYQVAGEDYQFFFDALFAVN